MKLFLQKYSRDVTGVLSGFDRLIFRGTIRQIASVTGMLSYLWGAQVLLKDFGKHVLAVSRRLKEAVVGAVQKLERPVIHVRRSSQRKEQTAREIAQKEGIEQGVICLLTAVEPCYSYEVGPNRNTKRLELRTGFRKCLFLYRYEIHPVVGFMLARIQSWFPFNVQIWINGREWLARQMDLNGLGYIRRGNCFTHLEDPVQAQYLMEQQLNMTWPRFLDGVLNELNPIRDSMFGPLRGGIYLPYYWSVDQSEWATDVMFRNAPTLNHLYPRFVQHGIQTFGSPDVLRFLGKKIPALGSVNPRFKGEIISDVRHRPEGICLKHRLNTNSIKLYDKQRSVLRIETTLFNSHEFKVYRLKEGEKRGNPSWRVLRKGIADIHRRAEVSQSANNRYADALALVDQSQCLGELINSLCKPAKLNGQRVRALAPWSALDLSLLKAVGRAEFVLSGFQNRDIGPLLFGKAELSSKEQRRRSAKITRLLRILRAHHIIKKVPRTHRYLVTKSGRRVISALITAYEGKTEQLTKLAA